MSKYYENLSNKAIELASMLGEKSIVVTGYPALNELVNELRSTGGCETAFSKAMTEACAQELSAVIASISTATFNGALPMVKRVMERLREVINPDVPYTYSQYNIHQVMFDPIWDTQFVMDLCAEGRNVAVTSFSVTGTINSPEEEKYADMAKLILTGVPAVDEHLSRLMSRYSEQDLRSMFSEVFTYGRLPDARTNSLFIDCDNDFCRERWILIAAWCENLRDLPPTESNYDYGRYRENLTLLGNHARQILSEIDARRQRATEAGQVVVDCSRNLVSVLNTTYVTYLKEGGSADAVLGYCLKGALGSTQTAEELKQQHDALVSAWSNHVVVSSAAHEQTMQRTARGQLYLILEGELSQRASDEIAEFPGQELQIKNKLKVDLDKAYSGIQLLPSDFTKDAVTWVTDIVANTCYPGSDVGLLLRSVVSVGESRPDLSPEKVRQLAVIQFAAGFLVSSVRVVGAGGNKTFSDIYKLEANKPSQVTGTMATESIDWKAVALVGAGIGVLAIVGFGIYKLITSMTGKKTETGGKAAESTEKRQEVIHEVEEEIKVDNVEIKQAIVENADVILAEAETPEEREAVEVLIAALKEGPILPTEADADLAEVVDNNVATEVTSIRTSKPIAAAVKKAIDFKSGKPKLWEGSLQNIVDVLGDSSVRKLSKGTWNVLSDRRSDHDIRVDGQFASTVATFMRTAEQCGLELYDAASDIVEYRAGGKGGSAELEKLTKAAKGKLITMVDMAISDLQDIVSKSNAPLGKLDVLDLWNKEGDVNQIRDSLAAMRVKTGEVTFYQKIKDHREGEVGDMSLDLSSTANVGEVLDKKVKLITERRYRETFEKMANSSKKALDALSKGESSDEYREGIEAIRWGFSQVDIDPELVNAYIDIVKFVNDYTAKTIDSLVDLAIGEIKDTFEAQGVYKKVIDRVKKKNAALKLGFAAPGSGDSAVGSDGYVTVGGSVMSGSKIDEASVTFEAAMAEMKKNGGQIKDEHKQGSLTKIAGVAEYVNGGLRFAIPVHAGVPFSINLINKNLEIDTRSIGPVFKPVHGLDIVRNAKAFNDASRAETGNEYGLITRIFDGSSVIKL